MHLTAAAQPFRLNEEWLKAQAFRWTDHDDGWCYGFVSGHLIKVKQSEGGIEFHSEASEESLAPRVRDYFRLDQDIAAVHAALRDLGGPMPGLVKKYEGLRVLRQDPWGCLVAYICSATARVERIKDNVDKLARCYGEPKTLGDVTYHSFPPPEHLVQAGEGELQSLGFGLNKGHRIYKAAKAIIDGELDLAALADAPYPEARKALMTLHGVGPKIADCVCLFALDKPEAFPVDRHIRNGLKQYYSEEIGTGASRASNPRLSRWAREYFGDHAGYAGQLLFLDRLHQAR